MTDGPVVKTDQHGATRVLTLNRPQRRNALSVDDRRELIAALDEAFTDPTTVSVVLTGAGPLFCAGGDISKMPTDGKNARVGLGVLTELVNRLVRGPKPIIAAVEGGAFGLGLSLVAASDFVVASSTARFAASFGRLGLVPDTGMFWTLTRRVGPARARELMLLTDDFSAEEGHRMGLSTELVEPGQTLVRALEIAQRLANGSPAMHAATKRIFAQAEDSLDAVLEAEAEAQVRLLATPYFSERKAEFLGR